MDEKKFLQQVYSKIRKREDLNIKLRDTCIEIDDGENLIFKIDSKGGMFYSADNQFREIVEKLHDEIQSIVCNVDEYLNAMESAEDLKAVDFNMKYKKLAEFNGVIFAGTEHSDGSFEFATWNYINGSLHLGHYFNDYEEAKNNFALRSGLIQGNAIFNQNELMEIYCRINEALQEWFYYSDEQIQAFHSVQGKIKESIPNFESVLKEYMPEDDEEEIINDQTM